MLLTKVYSKSNKKKTFNTSFYTEIPNKKQQNDLLLFGSGSITGNQVIQVENEFGFFFNGKQSEKDLNPLGISQLSSNLYKIGTVSDKK